ncbi:MAG: sugar phosphate isomerase/epimerase family protein [Thermomicrobiales bacterium]
MAAEPIALQLYTVRDLAKADFLGTLQKLADAGYTAVEFAGYWGAPAKELRTALDGMGIRGMGAHTAYALFDTEMERTLETLNVIGCEYATVPWLEPAQRPTTADAARALAETLNAWGEATRAAGIRLGYHNHDFEFARVGDSTVYDLLAERTDPGLVDLQLDVYWAQVVGGDPAELISRYPNRMPLLHVKDVAADNKTDAPFGEGIVDWARVLSVARKNGTRWWIVEQDTPADPIADVTRSLNNLKAALARLEA